AGMTGRARVLVVDDEESIRRELQQLLSLHGLDVATAADGSEGLAHFQTIRPDVVLTDVAMPRADGFWLIQRIREKSATPILVLSVRGGDVDKVRALDLGADDFVVKP